MCRGCQGWTAPGEGTKGVSDQLKHLEEVLKSCVTDTLEHLLKTVKGTKEIKQMKRKQGDA